MRPLAFTAVVVLAAVPSFAQSEGYLKSFFEGRKVTVRIDMPANESGIDVRPGMEPVLDYSVYGNRIRSYGVAVPEGQPIIVTKVKVKKDLIEFQLGGGGADAPYDRHHTYVGKSSREEELEKERKKTTDSSRRSAIDRELDGLRRDRQRDEEQARALDAIANAAERDRQRDAALAGGSRFNIRFKPAVPPEALTPDGVMRALAAFVDFSGLPGAPAAPRGQAGAAMPARRAASNEPLALRKGMSREEVEQLVGGPRKETKRAEGSLTTVVAVYEQGDSVIEATFLDGTLIKYTISSR